MSYSFSVKANTREEAKAKVAEQLTGVVAGQPSHSADMKQAQAAADAFIDLLGEDDSKEVLVNMSGSLSWEWVDGTVTEITGANINVSAWLTQKK